MPIFKQDIKAIKEGRYQEINFSSSGYGDKEAIELANLLKEHPHIKRINLSRNNIQDLGAKALAELDSVEEIDLENNDIGDEGATALVKNLYINKLNLTRNGISNEAALEFAKIATQTELKLDRMIRIKPETLKSVAARVEENGNANVYYSPLKTGFS